MEDYQRQAVYDAEEICSFWLQGKHLSVKEADKLITRISKWAKIEKPYCQFNATDKEGEVFPVAKGMAHTIILPEFAMNESYICHEMAHVITYQKKQIDYHGPKFIKIYLDIIKEILGVNNYKELLNTFKIYNIKGI